MVASGSAVHEDAGEAGMQVCCSWGLFPVHTPGDQGDGSAHLQSQSHVSLLLCWLLKVREEWSHEGFPDGGA